MSFWMTLSDLEWVSKIFNDTQSVARSLCDSWASCLTRCGRDRQFHFIAKVNCNWCVMRLRWSITSRCSLYRHQNLITIKPPPNEVQVVALRDGDVCLFVCPSPETRTQNAVYSKITLFIATLCYAISLLMTAESYRVEPSGQFPCFELHQLDWRWPLRTQWDAVDVSVQKKNALNWLTPSIVQSTSNRIMHITCEVHSLTLQSSEAIIVPHRIIWSWYTRRWWVGCYISYCDEGTGRGRSLPRSLIAVPNWQPAHQRPVYQQSYCGIMVCCPMCIQLAKSTM